MATFTSLYLKNNPKKYYLVLNWEILNLFIDYEKKTDTDLLSIFKDIDIYSDVELNIEALKDYLSIIESYIFDRNKLMLELKYFKKFYNEYQLKISEHTNLSDIIIFLYCLKLMFELAIEKSDTLIVDCG